MRRFRPWGAPELSAEPSGPRVLIEDPDPAGGWATSTLLRRAGYEPVWCGGPTLHGSPCPLVRGEGCAAADEAAAVVSFLRVGKPQERAVLEALRDQHPTLPVIAEVSQPDQLAGLGDGLATEVVRTPARKDDLLDALERWTDRSSA